MTLTQDRDTYPGGEVEVFARAFRIENTGGAWLAAVVIGGVPITGGRGGIVGTFFGVLLLGVISNMLNLMRVDPFLQDIAFGLLIVLALGVSWLRTRVGSEG